MTQADAKDWAIAHGCSIFKVHKSFTRMMNENGKKCNIPKPRDGQDHLSPMTLCKCFVELDVPMPDCAANAHEVYKAVHKKIQEEEGQE